MILSSFFCYILNMGYILNIDNIYYCLDNDILFPILVSNAILFALPNILFLSTYSLAYKKSFPQNRDILTIYL